MTHFFFGQLKSTNYSSPDEFPFDLTAIMSKRGRRNTRFKRPQSKTNAASPCEFEQLQESHDISVSGTSVSDQGNGSTAGKNDGEFVHGVEGGDNMRIVRPTAPLGKGSQEKDQLSNRSEQANIQNAGSSESVRESELMQSAETQPTQSSPPQRQSDSRELDDGYGDLDCDMENDEMWNDARELKLIELYRDCPFLWNKTLSSYQLRNKQEVSYNKFAGILGVTCKLLCKIIILN